MGWKSQLVDKVLEAWVKENVKRFGSAPPEKETLKAKFIIDFTLGMLRQNYTTFVDDYDSRDMSDMEPRMTAKGLYVARLEVRILDLSWVIGLAVEEKNRHA